MYPCISVYRSLNTGFCHFLQRVNIYIHTVRVLYLSVGYEKAFLCYAGNRNM